MSQELVLFEGLLVWTGWVFAEARVERLVSFKLFAHAHAMLIEVPLVVIINGLLEQLVLLWALWVRASSWVDRFPLLTLDNERLGTAPQCQLLLKTDAILLVGLPMILSHVLSQRHACFRAVRYVTEIALASPLFQLPLRVSLAWHHYVGLNLTDTVLGEGFLVQAQPIV